MSRERFYRLGLIGRNISHSLSPRIHQWALAVVGLRGEYVLHDVDIEGARAVVRSSEWEGLNVTIPHKSALSASCNSLSETARRASSVNTLVRRAGDIIGDSTDGAGFLFALRRFADERNSFDKVLVIGGGGAARAILAALRDAGPTTNVFVAVRSPERARIAGPQLFSKDAKLELISLERAAERLRSFDLIVQATPTESPLPLPLRFHPGACVMDVICAPRRTEFLQIAGMHGARVQNGLAMLIGQAAVSFKIWTGVEFPRDRAMHELLPELESS
ncbi:MAG: shikimate dehydrogenase [bacterium]|nr:shikimate dehydrogenase [bacterium]